MYRGAFIWVFYTCFGILGVINDLICLNEQHFIIVGLYLLAAQEGHPEVVLQLSPVLLGEGAGVWDEGCGEEDVPTESSLLFMVLSYWVGPSYILTLRNRTHEVRLCTISNSYSQHIWYTTYCTKTKCLNSALRKVYQSKLPLVLAVPTARPLTSRLASSIVLLVRLTSSWKQSFSEVAFSKAVVRVSRLQSSS